MKRRTFLGLAGATGLGGFAYGMMNLRQGFAQDNLTKHLSADAMKLLVPKHHRELNELPSVARESIKAKFVTYCLNSSLFVKKICSETFRETLTHCETPDLRRQVVANAFVSTVASQEEILGQVSNLATDIGTQLDLNWGQCCIDLSKNWNLHIREYGASLPADLEARFEPGIRNIIRETVELATTGSQRPSISETVNGVGESAVWVLLLTGTGALVGGAPIAVPLFLVTALESVTRYLSGRISSPEIELRATVSSKMTNLARHIGTEFETEVRTRIAELHKAQEQIVLTTARRQAQDVVGLL